MQCAVRAFGWTPFGEKARGLRRYVVKETHQIPIGTYDL